MYQIENYQYRIVMLEANLDRNSHFKQYYDLNILVFDKNTQKHVTGIFDIILLKIIIDKIFYLKTKKQKNWTLKI